jgi:hypothetical protein
MALSRTAVLLLLLPAPGAVYMAASMEGVNANSQCLPSAEAVRQQYPGSWASWTTHAADHKGEKCWFPAARETRTRHVETMLRQAAQKLMGKEMRKTDEPAAVDATPAAIPVALTTQMNELGWSLRTRSGAAGPASLTSSESEAPHSSFDDRFAASRDVTSVQKPSVIQRMMDPVGAIPNIP